MKSLTPSKTPAFSLAKMSVPQLADAGKALDRAGDLYENTAGICRLLQGLVLLAAKGKLDHGRFMPWVKLHFPKSHREAGNRMKAARDFEANFKLEAPFQFDAQSLLLGDLAGNLTEISHAQLDMKNPVVEAASKYIGNRSWTQLLLDLGDDTKPARKKSEDLTPEEEYQLVHDRLKKDAGELFSGLDRYADKKHFQVLNDAELDTAILMLTRAKDAMEAWRKMPKGKRLATAVQDSIREWKGASK